MYRKFRQALPFLLPGLIGILVFYIVPFGGGIWYSLRDGGFEDKFVGFDNYIAVWSNPMFRLGLKNTLLLSLIGAPLLWLLSFIPAVILNRVRPAGGFFGSAVLLPYLMPSCAVLIVWLLWFDYGGPVNRMLTAIGLERQKFLQGSMLRLPVILMFLWKNLGFCVVIFTAALEAIPEPLYEYAELEGASFLKKSFGITLPLIVPSAFLVLILAWINAFRVFKEVYFISGAYPDESVYTLQHYMNNMYSKLNYQNVTSAAYTFAVMVFALFGVLFIIQHRAQRGLN